MAGIHFGWKHKLLLAVGIPLLLLLGLEGVARVIPSPSGIGASDAQAFQLEMPSWMVEARVQPRTFTAKETKWMSQFESGDRFRVRLIPHSSFEFADTFSWTRDFAPSNFQVEANSLGFRSPEPPPHGVPDLIVFGDSSSFGWGVEYRDTYTGLVSTILSKRALNFAMPGDSSEFGKLIFDSFAPEYMARTAIVSFGANDARLSSIPHKALVHEYSEVLWLHALQKGLFERSELFRKLTDALTPQPTSPASKVSRGGPAVRLKQYKQNLAYMVRRSRELGAQQVLLLGVCSPSTYLKAMRLTAKRLGAYFVNGQLKMKESVPPLQNGQLFSAESQELRDRFGSHIKNQPLLYVTSDGCHPNAIGHKLIAEEIVHALRGPQPEPVKLKKKKRKKRAKHPGRKAKRQKQVSERQKDRRAL